jgi:hypothetical protein
MVSALPNAPHPNDVDQPQFPRRSTPPDPVSVSEIGREKGDTMKPITREAALELADHLRSAYPIDRDEFAAFLEAAAVDLPAAETARCAETANE